jgi:hypothetical protein
LREFSPSIFLFLFLEHIIMEFKVCGIPIDDVPKSGLIKLRTFIPSNSNTNVMWAKKYEL